VFFLCDVLLSVAQKLDRVKVNDKFAFPTVLPPSWLLGGDDSSHHHGTGWSEHYDLEAILVHKGVSARHGHYGEKKNCFDFITVLVSY
jgi:uncharacterized UBP type Zn finger protein